MLQFKALVFTLFITLVVNGTGYGANLGDDKDPFPAYDDPFWKTNGGTKTFPLYDGNNYQVLKTKYFYAVTNLQSNHCIDSQTAKHGHFHTRDDFYYGDNIYEVDYSTQSKDYWDVVFQNGVQANISGGLSTTTGFNCFTYALRQIDLGIYNYWVDDSNAFVGFGGAGEASAAFAADSSTKNAIDPKTNAPNIATGDVYVYALTILGKPTILHATTVFSFNCGAPPSLYLKWKFNASGTYQFGPITPTFNTPKYIFNNEEQEENPLPAGQWKVDGAGSQGQLHPPGKIRHANPKQN